MYLGLIKLKPELLCGAKLSRLDSLLLASSFP